MGDDGNAPWTCVSRQIRQILQRLNGANRTLHGKAAGMGVHSLAPQIGRGQQAFDHLSVF